jgi:hypothetical protein
MLAREIATALIDSFRSRGKASTRCYGEWWDYLKGGTVLTSKMKARKDALRCSCFFLTVNGNRLFSIFQD